MAHAFFRFGSIALVLAGCQGMVADPSGMPGEGPADPTDDDGELEGPIEDPTRPTAAVCDSFDASPVAVHAAKVKNLLTGLALTDAELMALTEDPDALPSYVDAWLATPEAERKLVRFFVTAFQQEGFEAEGLASQYGDDGNRRMGNVPGTRTNAFDVLARNVEESFARTALAHVRARRPFNELVTTDTFMMTTAMMVMLSFQDDASIADDGDPRYRTLGDRIPDVRFTRAAVPIARTLDPTSPDFMKFSVDDVEVVPTGCTEVVQSGRAAPLNAFRAMMGFYSRIGTEPCRGARQARKESVLERADFEDWRPVRVRAPNTGEGTSQFYELESLRASDELVVHTPRLGFFTTPAFFSTWATNEDNQARVTANQMLIVAFGQSIDSSDSTFVIVDDALDGEHADPTTACYGCHRTLDPMRQFFRRDYSYFYGQQRNADVRAVPAAFAFDGVDGTGDDIAALAELVATHPSLPAAWAQKLCFYANGAECPAGEELDRVVAAFTGSGLDFGVLVRELFSSPLVTSASCIEGGTGDNAGISRTRHFCHSLSVRLGISDPCGIEGIWPEDRSRLGGQNAAIIATVPDDAFSRGDEDPVLITDVNLFVRGTYEQVCMNVAGELVGAGRPFDPADADAAFAFFVAELMGLPASDPRHTEAGTILRSHFDEAQTEGATAQVALQSAFTLACMSPSLTGLGL